jgi:ATP-dependent Clp protease ATP-binding subunit ClpC
MRFRLRTLMSLLKPRRGRTSASIVKDQWTDRARFAMKLAEQEAGRLNHEYLATEHLFFGLASDRRGIAAELMQEMIGGPGKILRELEKLMLSGPESAAHGTFLVTPRLRKSLDAAAEEAHALNHKDIGSEHLLLGLLRDPDGLPAAVLAALNVDADVFRQRVLDLIGKNKNG